MKRKIALLLLTAAAVFALHAGFLIWRAERIARQWVDIRGGDSPFRHYILQRDYLLSLSYAIVASFTLYSLMRARERAKSGAAGVAGGFTLASLLALGGCWLVGCCGSPLLPVYLSLFGSSFAGFTKPLVFALTLSSVGLSLWLMNRKSQRNCGCNDSRCETDAKALQSIQEIHAELAEGMNLPKCQQCGCMKETLEQLGDVLPSLKTASAGALASELGAWQQQMKPIKYACLGCEHCYPAVAMNVLHKQFPQTEKIASLSCEFEVRPDVWPPVPGEYFDLCEGDGCPVAVSTLASPELADTLAKRRPSELCIVGKTETENIGIDKLIKNTITNRTIRYLIVAGRDPKGHDSGKTLLALASNGVDDSMRVIGSSGRRPILRNVTRDEVEAFRRQVEVVNMIGCDDVDLVINRVKDLSAAQPSSCSCSRDAQSVISPAVVSNAPVVHAQPPTRVEMDKAGYFVIIPRAHKGDIIVEHYSYDNKMLRTIEGRDARSIYSTIVQNGWVSQLSHAAYLGKELTRAELSLKHGFKFVQDGA